MERDTHSDEQIQEILSMKDVAVVGMSSNPEKASHRVPKYLMSNGYNIIPVNPSKSEILGQKCYHSLDDISSTIDIVEVFVASENVLPIVRQAIGKNPKIIWFQLGIHNQEAEELARENGIDVVFNRCMFAEHSRLC